MATVWTVNCQTFLNLLENILQIGKAWTQDHYQIGTWTQKWEFSCTLVLMLFQVDRKISSRKINCTNDFYIKNLRITFLSEQTFKRYRNGMVLETLE